MVTSSMTEELAMAVPAEVLWKAIFATCDEPSLRNLFTGWPDAVVKVEGDGSPGRRYSLKFTQSRMVARDNATRVISFDEVAMEGGECQFKVEPAGADGCVIKIAVESERLDGTPRSLADDQAKLTKLFVDLIKKVEQNIVPRPQYI
ncbi:hypothetical protein PVAP13_6NG037100 [Panicum virgatum]|uniref:Uncharacterized protein n=1 Tax=Panicum virgatum TaxID=38727 RepID=A0A8T0QTQ4_PANVG|nr:hypothetical protein PVAP13_6NG037100 [Panicum virgatum]